MLAQYLDLTEEYNTNGNVYFETSNYDYAVVQIINNTESPVLFYATIDSGTYTASPNDNLFDPNPINWSPIVGTQLSDSTLVNIASGTDVSVRFDVVGRYIKLQSDDVASVGKLLVMLTKIS